MTSTAFLIFGCEKSGTRSDDPRLRAAVTSSQASEASGTDDRAAPPFPFTGASHLFSQFTNLARVGARLSPHQATILFHSRSTSRPAYAGLALSSAMISS